MIPITGPHDRLQSGHDWYKYRRSYRQRKPYNLPLPFDSKGYRTLKATKDFHDTVIFGAGYYPTWCRAGFPGDGESDGAKQFTSAISNTQSIARERFNSKLRDTAEMGAALAEFSQAASMVSSRALQLYRFTKALRRFDFPSAGRELNRAVYGKDGRYYARVGGSPKRLKLRRDSRAFASNYLEYSFGWAPLVSDITSAMDVLASPQRGTRNVRARAQSNDTLVRSQNNWYPFQPVIMRGEHAYQVSVTCSADVEVLNPNISLAAQLGFVNPVSVGWEIVPFSFVVDYFVNVQSYLENYSSLFGLQLSNVWSTTYVRDVCNLSETWWDGRPGSYAASDYYRTTRTNSLPDVKLRQKQFTLPIGRALTSVSLLVSLGIKR